MCDARRWGQVGLAAARGGSRTYVPREALLSLSPKMFLGRRAPGRSGSGLRGAARAGVGGASGVFCESWLCRCCGPEASAEWVRTRAQTMLGVSRLFGRHRPPPVTDPVDLFLAYGFSHLITALYLIFLCWRLRSQVYLLAAPWEATWRGLWWLLGGPRLFGGNGLISVNGSACSPPGAVVCPAACLCRERPRFIWLVLDGFRGARTRGPCM